MHVFVQNNLCFNVDNDVDASRLLKHGARELSIEEIQQYGMTGYEHYVGPDNTTVNADGTVSFVLPEVATFAFEALRIERDRRLAETDYMFTSDYPLDASKRSAYMAYRQALRDLPAQPGAPWTVDTIPWPVKPE